MMTTTLIFLMLAIPFSACDKGKTINVEKLDTPIPSKDVDLAVSSWYLNQFEAIDILSRILKIRIEYGSKIKNSPHELMKIQQDAILKFESEAGNRDLTPWAEKQKIIFQELEKKILIKGKMLPVADGGASRQGLAYLEAQIHLIDQSGMSLR